MFNISVPIPPSINHCYFYVKGRRIKNNDARKYEEKLNDLVTKKLNGIEDYFFAPEKKVICDMKFYFPDRRRRDTHNTFKLLFDVIEKAGLYKDDKYILPRVINWEIDRVNPRLDLIFYYKE